MANFFKIITHWSDHNPLAEKALSQAVQQDIAGYRQTKRYRRLMYYFFEKEIIADTTKRLSVQYRVIDNVIGNSEVQALVQRSAMQMISKDQQMVSWYEPTRLLNDYILGQGEFLYDTTSSDTLILKKLLELLDNNCFPQSYKRSVSWVSDVLVVLRCRRHDISIVHSLLTGQYNYRSLLQACGDHIAQFGALPIVFDYLPELSWSSDSLLQLLDSDIQEQLRPLLQPQYELVCQYIDLVSPYGQHNMVSSPYSSWFSRLGYYWSQQSWWIKLLVSIAIIAGSSLLGIWSLILMPLVWGMLQGAGSVWDYVCMLGKIAQDWYHSYTTQHARYLTLYETMIDPECSTHDTMHAQQLMSRRYDVLACGGHELVRDVQLFSQKCIHYIGQIIANHEISDDFLRDLAQMQAIQRRGEDHQYSLWVISQDASQEQQYTRFFGLLNLCLRVARSHQLLGYEEQYEAIKELMNNKVSQFHKRTFVHGIKDGLVVAFSSGILGWLGAYLWNRSARGQQVFAASGGLVYGMDPLSVVDDKLLDPLTTHLSQSDVSLLVETLQQGNASSTLWDTLTKLFGHKVGNTTNTLMMDNWWRALDEQGKSELFVKAFDRGMPLSSHDSGWSALMSFLDHIYGYDNFVDHQSLIHGKRLSETLTSLHNGTMTIDQFAQLSQAQREIVTQSLFTAVRQEDVAGLLLDTPSSIVDHLSSVSTNALPDLSSFTFPVIRSGKKAPL